MGSDTCVYIHMKIFMLEFFMNKIVGWIFYLNVIFYRTAQKIFLEQVNFLDSKILVLCTVSFHMYLVVFHMFLINW